MRNDNEDEETNGNGFWLQLRKTLTWVIPFFFRTTGCSRPAGTRPANRSQPDEAMIGVLESIFRIFGSLATIQFYACTRLQFHSIKKGGKRSVCAFLRANFICQEKTNAWRSAEPGVDELNRWQLRPWAMPRSSQLWFPTQHTFQNDSCVSWLLARINLSLFWTRV